MGKLNNQQKTLSPQPVIQNELHHNTWMVGEHYEERPANSAKIDKVKLLGLWWQKLYSARRKEGIDSC